MVRPLSALVAVVVTLSLAGVPAWGQSFEVVTRFASGPILPSELVQAPDGRFYSTSSNGGNFGLGSVFRVELDGTITVLHSFAGNDGLGPVAGLTLAGDGFFYGTTLYGGMPAEGGGFEGNGTIFRMDADGGFETLYFFSTDNPGSPHTRLVEADHWLYGTTDSGLAFRFHPATGVYETLHVFSPATEGSEPSALIRASDGAFYGTLRSAGTLLPGGSIGGFGSIFRMDSSGGVTILNRFTTQSATVLNPNSLIQGVDGFFYGTSAQFTSFNPNVAGAVFRMDWGGNVTLVHEFAQPDQFPCHDITCPSLLALPDGSLYGTSKGGGVDPGCGFIFRIDASGVYTRLYAFDCVVGAGAKSTLILASDQLLYGTTHGDFNSLSAGGTVYRSSTTGVVDLVRSFATQTGMTPIAPLLNSGGYLYGAALEGNEYGRGEIFRVDSAGLMTVVHTFSPAEQGSPRGGFVDVGNGVLFGTSSGYYGNDMGTVFRFDTSGGFETLHVFSGTDGAYPIGGLIQATNGFVYGTTSSDGPGGRGTVFRISLSGTFETMHAFEGGEFDGAAPAGTLLQASDGFLYGTTNSGGAFDLGTVFRMDLSGVVTILHSFEDVDGAYPWAGLIQGRDGFLYGTTQLGGDGSGTIFRIDTAGSLTLLYSFYDETGIEPVAPLVEGPDGLLYGTTSNLGTPDSWEGGRGTVFRLGVDQTISVLHRFDDEGTTGTSPLSGLVRGSDGLYYGNTSGGASGGVIFRLNIASETPPGSNIQVQPVDPVTGTAPVNLTFGEVTQPGATTVTVSATGEPPPANFVISNPATYFDIQTTATFAGTIQVCVSYAGLTLADPATASLLHFDGTAWADVTTSRNLAAKIICGEVDSLSPFVLGNVGSGSPYTVRALFDQEKVYKAGSTIPIRVQILQDSVNVSDQNLPLVATGIRKKTTETNWGVPEDPGQSNPDLNFRFADLNGEPGYQFNLKTAKSAIGTYELKFRVGTDGPELVVEYQIR